MDVGDVGDVGRLPIPEPIVEFGDAPGDVDEEEYGEVINRSDGVDMSWLTELRTCNETCGQRQQTHEDGFPAKGGWQPPAATVSMSPRTQAEIVIRNQVAFQREVVALLYISWVCPCSLACFPCVLFPDSICITLPTPSYV
jgi:hypothetical protein